MQGTPVKEGAPWAFIAVMGVTGAGKSTFTKTVSGDDTVEVGDGLTSCTSELKGYCFHHAGYNINLVDSPGFNDTYRSETDVLQDISTWLKQSYEMNNKLSGIIYMHSILQPRLEGSALRNLKMFRELCGTDPLKNVILATTFWGDVRPSLGEAREQELAQTSAFWGDMIARGSRMARFTDRASGLDIVEGLLGCEPEALKIQRELVEDSKQLIDTAAGQVVNAELARLEVSFKEKEIRLQLEMEDALKQRDAEMQQILEQDRRRLEAEIERVHRQQDQLRADRRAENRRMQNQLDIALHDFKIREDELKYRLEEMEDDGKRRQRERVETDRKNELAQQRWETQNQELMSHLRKESRRHKSERAAQEERIRQERSSLEAQNAELLDQLISESERHQQERTRQDERLVELERYNEQIRQQWDGLDLDATIAKIRAEESKLHPHEREKMEAEIGKVKKSNMPKAKKKARLMKVFFSILQFAIPVATMCTLGVPLGIPGLSSLMGSGNEDASAEQDAAEQPA